MSAEIINPLPPLILIPDALGRVLGLIRDIMRKNQTMIDYYIYPDSTPSEIEAYGPPLELLHARIENLSAIRMSKLEHLINDAESIMADAIMPIIDQLVQSARGFQKIFIEHYNRDLEDKPPYEKIIFDLCYRRDQLFSLKDNRMMEQPPLAVALAPLPSNTELTFCRSAIAYVNRRDEGKLSQVMSEDLSSEQRDQLKSRGGAFLWWECTDCAFRMKYHITFDSRISESDDVRSHFEAPGVEYRVSWLVKTHLFQMATRDRDRDRMPEQGSERKQNETKRRGSEGQRRDTIFRDRRSGSMFWVNQLRRPSGAVSQETSSKPKETQQSRQKDPDKHGCPFCYAIGKELVSGNTAFTSARDLARHIASRHKPRGSKPQIVLLNHYVVASKGVPAVGPESNRWDLNLK